MKNVSVVSSLSRNRKRAQTTTKLLTLIVITRTKTCISSAKHLVTFLTVMLVRGLAIEQSYNSATTPRFSLPKNDPLAASVPTEINLPVDEEEEGGGASPYIVMTNGG